MITRVAKGLRTFGRPNAPPLTESGDGIALPTRTPKQRRQHYEIEKELAERLRLAERDERLTLYSHVYDELYRRVPHHPQLQHKVSASDTARRVRASMRFLEAFLTPGTRFLEIGAGDCSLALEAARHVRHVTAVDVSDEITRGISAPGNFELCLSDGRSIPVPPGSIDVAYSNQLMEHLHPDDALEQLRNVHAALAPGGVYVCRTPNALNGPHDVSAGFDCIATGLHLKEYTVTELYRLFRRVGFSKVKLAFAMNGPYVRSSVHLTMLAERLLRVLGYPAVQPELLKRPVRALLGIRMLGIR